MHHLDRDSRVSLTDWWDLNNQFDILLPLAIGVLAGFVTWWLLGLRNRDRAQSGDAS